MDSSHLPRRLRMREAFWFPVSTSQARKDILVGGLLVIFLLIIGWILNLGSRPNVVGRFYRNEQPVFRGFAPIGYTFKRGCISFLTISLYLAPSALFAACAFLLKLGNFEKLHYVSAVLSATAFVLGVFTLPGGMTVYACVLGRMKWSHPIASSEATGASATWLLTGQLNSFKCFFGRQQSLQPVSVTSAA